MKRIVCFIVITMFALIASAQQTIDCRLTQSYITQNMKEWNTFIDELTVEINKNYSAELQFKRLIVRHLYLAYLLFNDKESKQIAIQLEGMQRDYDALLQDANYSKKVLAFRSPLLAYAALDNPLTAVYRLPMSFSAAKTAISEAGNSPYSWSEYGNLQYCFALFVGSSFDDAVKSFKKAIDLMEKMNTDKSCDWYYINSLLFLAKSYEDGKQYNKANAVYDKLIALRPDYAAAKRWRQKNLSR